MRLCQMVERPCVEVIQAGEGELESILLSLVSPRHSDTGLIRRESLRMASQRPYLAYVHVGRTSSRAYPRSICSRMLNPNGEPIKTRHGQISDSTPSVTCSSLYRIWRYYTSYCGCAAFSQSATGTVKIQYSLMMNVQVGKRLGRAALRKEVLLPKLRRSQAVFLSLWHPPAFENEATV